jgi:PhnB protein
MSNEPAHPDTPQPPVAPQLILDRGAEAMDWYKRAFGATELSRQMTPDGSKLVHGAMLINGGLVMLSDDFEQDQAKRQTPTALKGSPVIIHLTMADVDGLYRQAVAAGATATMEPADMFWGSRYGQLVDPFGHQWSFGTPQAPVTQEQLDKGAAEAFKQ